jgi:hypothetical protein
MTRQRVIIGRQLGTMASQFREMAAQTALLKEYVGHTETTAIAAKQSADAARDSVETFISKERARIRIEMRPFETSPSDELLGNSVSYRVICFGATPAFIDYAFAVAEVTESSDPPTESIIFGTTNLGPVIAPGGLPKELRAYFRILTESEKNQIEQGMLHVHFRGSIHYRDFRDTNRETDFCYTWKVMGYMPGIPLSEWVRSGPPEANRTT